MRIRTVNRNISGGGFDADYQAVLDYATANAITHPTGAQNIINNAIIVNLKAEGVWDFDLFYMFKQDANMDFVRINWADPSSYYLGMTATNPIFTNNVGISCEGSTTSHFTTGFTPSTDAVVCLKEDSSMIYKTFVPLVASGDFYICGGRGGTLSETYQRIRFSDNRLFNDHYGNDGIFDLPDSDAHHLHLNGNGGVEKAFVDGSLYFTGTNVTTGGLTVQEIYILAINGEGAHNNADYGLEYMLWGSEMESKQSEIYDIMSGTY